MIPHLLANDMQIDIGWVLGAIGALGTTIATLAGVMWGFVKSRLLAQDKLIEAQTAMIAKLQDDIDRLGKGCGHAECLWKHRT